MLFVTDNYFIFLLFYEEWNIMKMDTVYNFCISLDQEISIVLYFELSSLIFRS